jgi:hypothetical protein
MITIICGDRNCIDYTILEKAIDRSGFIITETYSGHAKGSDALGEMWAKANNVPVKLFPAKWNEIKSKNAVIKTRINPWTKKQEKYNVNAGRQRNQEMIDAGAECVIALQPYGETSGTQHTIKLAHKKGIPVYVLERENKDYEYKF